MTTKTYSTALSSRQLFNNIKYYSDNNCSAAGDSRIPSMMVQDCGDGSFHYHCGKSSKSELSYRGNVCNTLFGKLTVESREEGSILIVTSKNGKIPVKYWLIFFACVGMIGFTAIATIIVRFPLIIPPFIAAILAALLIVRQYAVCRKYMEKLLTERILADDSNHTRDTVSKTNIFSQQSAALPDWTCPSCGRINAGYVGTCGCGTRKS